MSSVGRAAPPPQTDIRSYAKDGEAKVQLPGRYPVTGALKAVPGVVAVEHA